MADGRHRRVPHEANPLAPSFASRISFKTSGTRTRVGGSGFAVGEATGPTVYGVESWAAGGQQASPLRSQPCIKRGLLRWAAAVCRSRHLPPPLLQLHPTRRLLSSGAGLMASNYVDTAPEEGRFHAHGYHHGTTPTGAAAASPKHMRRSWSSASSANGHGHGHGAGPKCVCAPATHAGSFKCRLHRSSSHGHGHPVSPPSPAAAATSAAPPPSSRTVAAQ